jgi:hypothetical protein
MKYLSVYTPDQKTAGAPPTREHMAEMGKLIEESIKSGILVSTGGLQPISKGGAVVRRNGSEITVLDGPFAETKELAAGYAVLEVRSSAEAIEIARKFLKVAGEGECELRQMMEQVPEPSR